jgi:hypothetical protein
VAFHPGDRVQFDGGGCVQKKAFFIDPEDQGTESFPRALMFVPGITMAFVPVADLIGGRIFQVPRDVKTDRMILWLAYNRETHRTSERKVAGRHAKHNCSPRSESPFVKVTWLSPLSERKVARRARAAERAFDLRLTDYDDNSLPRNPRWVGQDPQGSQGTLPGPGWCRVACEGLGGMGQRDWRVELRCSSLLPYLDVGNVRPCQAEQFMGHVNFGPATYDGTILFKDWQDPDQFLDDDLDFFFHPQGGAGLTAANEERGTDGRYIEVEINNHETRFKSKWWRELKQWAKESTKRAQSPTKRKRKPCNPPLMGLARWLCTPSQAVVIGLLGLDTAHRGKSELHPVFGLALRDPTRSEEQRLDDDLWAIFAQNAGRQGEFGKSWHYLDVSQLTFRLEGPPGRFPEVIVKEGPPRRLPETIIKPSVFEPRVGDRVPMVRLRALPGVAVVTIELPRVIEKGKPRRVLVDGELHLRWKVQPPVSYESLKGVRPAVVRKEID